MGVVYKLKPEIKDFILEKRKEEPNLGARKLSLLIKEKFNLKVSKSAICLFLKSVGLNLPIGRPREKKRIKSNISLISPSLKQEERIEAKTEVSQKSEEISQVIEPVEIKEKEIPQEISLKISLEEKKEQTLPQEFITSGAILIKLIDSLLEGTKKIKEFMKEHKAEEFKEELEEVIFSPLFNQTSLKPWFIPRLTEKEKKDYLEKLQRKEQLIFKIYEFFAELIKPARAIELKLNSGERIYLDAGFHTVWSTPHLPYYFSSLACSVKKQLKEEKLVLFTAPGYENPIKEFGKFLEIIKQEEKIIQVVFYDQNINPAESILEKEIMFSKFIFGLWPWQFGHFRRGKLLSEFKSYYFAPLKKEFFIADLELNLTQPEINKELKLKGIALKRNLQDKIGLFILTDFNSEMSSQELFYNYLNSWPNLEEGFKDYQKRIELSTYFFISWDFFQEAKENLKDAGYKIEQLFKNYIKILEAYLKNLFLPPEKESFSLETLYSLPCKVKIQEDFSQGEILSLPDSEYYRILYICRRLNEKRIYFPENKRFWLILPEKKTLS